ncbi:MAG: hypothetical protein J6Y37_18535 [Paludibacteraceae bacterium]|nr:hypothetical protein [Paludibacteraceae bacterium]
MNYIVSDKWGNEYVSNYSENGALITENPEEAIRIETLTEAARIAEMLTESTGVRWDAIEVI